MNNMKKVEEEFEESFWDVVKGFADDGESATATAYLLGYRSHASFLRLLHRHGVRHWFKTDKTNGVLQAQRNRRFSAKALERARQANPSIKWVEVDGVVDSVRRHAIARGLSPSTVYSRLNRGVSVGIAFRKHT